MVAMRRVRIVLLVSGVVSAALLIVVSVRATSRRDRPQRSSDAADIAPLAAGTELTRPPRVPAVSLTDAAGRRVSLAHWRGKWIVLTSTMTLCQEVCPMTTGALMQLRSQLRRAGLAHRVVVMEATVDPWRDHPARLRAYRRLTGARFPMLTGTPAQIHRLWKFFGVAYRRVPEGKPPQIDWMAHRPLTFDIDHTDGLFIIGPSGRERVAEQGMPDVRGRLSRTLRGLLDAKGRHNLAHPTLPWSADQILSDLEHVMSLPPSGDHRNIDVTAPTARATARALRGSPAPLADLHHQANRLLGSTSALAARVRALRGYPIVINAWASWCTACRGEYALMANAALHDGRRVAFLGVDVNDSAPAAASFMRTHPLAYPSYTSSSRQLGDLANLEGLPTTIFINRRGTVTDVHTGSYDALSPLEDDIARFALGASPDSSS